MVFLNHLFATISYSSWYESFLKLNWFGLDLNLFPIKYGYWGNLKFSKGPELSTDPSLIVAKYAYTPFGKSGVTQYLPLCSSRSPSPVNTKSSQKNPCFQVEIAGRFESVANLYPLLSALTVPPVLVLYP